MPAPSTTQAARYTGSVGARPMPASPAAYSSELAASTGRPPLRSMMKPTLGAMSPATSRPMDTPPTTQPSDQPVSETIGSASTAGK